MSRTHGSSKLKKMDPTIQADASRANSFHESRGSLRPRMEVAEGLAPLEVISRAQEGSEHVIQHDSIEYEAEYRASMIMMNSPGSYFSDPLATVLSEPAREFNVFRERFDAHEKKHRLLKSLNEFVLTLKRSNGILLPALSIGDELYTNAAKNAWDREQIPWEDQPRRSGEIEFFAAASETRLLLGCRDSFGFLEIDTLIDRIAVCLRNGVADSILKQSWGAGIGAFYVFDAAKSVYIGVNPGVESLVCAALPLGIRPREAEDITKNIHLVDIGRNRR